MSTIPQGTGNFVSDLDHHLDPESFKGFFIIAEELGLGGCLLSPSALLVWNCGCQKHCIRFIYGNCATNPTPFSQMSCAFQKKKKKKSSF